MASKAKTIMDLDPGVDSTLATLSSIWFHAIQGGVSRRLSLSNILNTVGGGGDGSSSLEMRSSGTFLQYRNDPEEPWKTIFDFDDISGGGSGIPKVYPVTQHGLDNSGTDNIKIPFRELLESVGTSGGGTILFTPGRYRFSPDADGLGIQVLWDNINIELMSGATIFLDDPDEHMRALGVNAGGVIWVGCGKPDDPTWFREWGFGDWDFDLTVPTRNRPPVLTANLNKGDTSATVDGNSGVQVGDWLMIQSFTERYLDSSPGQETRKTEFARVLSLEPGKINFESGVLDSYTAGTNAVTLTPVKLVEGFSLTGGGNIVGMPKEETVLPNGSGVAAVYLDFFHNAVVDCVNLFDNERSGVVSARGVNSVVSSVDIQAPDQPHSNDTQGYYGVYFAGTQNGLAIDISGTNVRHLVDTGSGNAVSRNIFYRRLRPKHTYGIAVSSHAVVNLDVDDIHVDDCNGGFIFRGENLKLRNVSGSLSKEGESEAISLGIWASNAELARQWYGDIEIENFNLSNASSMMYMSGRYGKVKIDNIDIAQKPGPFVPFMILLSPEYDSIEINRMRADHRGRNNTVLYLGEINVRDSTAWGAQKKGPLVVDGVEVIDGDDMFFNVVRGVNNARDAQNHDFVLKNLKWSASFERNYHPHSMIRINAGVVGQLVMENIDARVYSRSGSLYFIDATASTIAPIRVQNSRNFALANNRTLFSSESSDTFYSGDRLASQSGKQDKVCTATGTAGTLTGVTGTGVSGQAIIEVSDSSALYPGCWIVVNSTNYCVVAMDGNLLRLHQNLSANASSAAVSFRVPSFELVNSGGNPGGGSFEPFSQMVNVPANSVVSFNVEPEAVGTATVFHGSLGAAPSSVYLFRAGETPVCQAVVQGNFGRGTGVPTPEDGTADALYLYVSLGKLHILNRKAYAVDVAIATNISLV